MLFFIKGVLSLSESDNPRLKRTKKIVRRKNGALFYRLAVYYFATDSRRLRIEKMKIADTRQIAMRTPHTT